MHDGRKKKIKANWNLNKLLIIAPFRFSEGNVLFPTPCYKILLFLQFLNILIVYNVFMSWWTPILVYRCHAPPVRRNVSLEFHIAHIGNLWSKWKQVGEKEALLDEDRFGQFKFDRKYILVNSSTSVWVMALVLRHHCLTVGHS